MRIDHTLSNHDNVFGTYQFYNSHTVTAGALPLFGSTAPARDQVISLAEDHTFTPHLINEARIGYNRWVAQNIAEANSLGDVISQIGIPQGGTNGLAPTTPATGGVPYVTLTGYATFGTASNLPQSRWDNTFNYVDSLTWDHGKAHLQGWRRRGTFYKHSFFVTDNTGAFSFNGQFTGNGFADFLMGGLRTTQFALGDPNQHPYTNSASFYGQDQSKVARNLTLNLGVRYESFTPQKERNNFHSLSRLAVVPAGGGARRVLTEGLDRGVNAPKYTEDGKWINFLVADDLSTYPARIPAAGGPIEKLVRPPVVIAAWSSKAAHQVVTKADDNHPAEVFAWDAQSFRPLTKANDALLAELKLGLTEAVSYKSKDGTEVHGLLVKPSDYDPGKKYPALIRIHGGPTAQDEHVFQFERQWLASRGYLVLAITYRGSSGRGAQWSPGHLSRLGTQRR